ncbi:hypothetical protein [Sphingomonas sp. CFBP 8765]|uniref:hypothetical protein n=1 Tax=Sphingomonas sp. CFBP 8765 TaxID=2775274 RepID=UPI00177CF3DE|nr:hypothetical protein [Sphingomonas sp. CFBP 8765]MBD8469580.1 hypothetical protein [Sphingomonas sp. CFBP 8765]
MDLVTRIYHALGGGAAALAVIVALIALVGALAGVLTSYLVAGRTVYINSITAERSKWIEKLRTNIAAHSGLLAELSFTLHGQKVVKNEGSGMASLVVNVLTKINNSAAIIQLQLNPWNEIDKNILSLIESIVIRDGTDHNLVDEADKLLIAHSQWLLKAEWEKVKYEAHGGFYRWWYNNDDEKRLKEYRAWVGKEGSLTDVLARFAKEKARK